MKTQLVKAVLPAILCLVSITQSIADTFTKTDGEVLEGAIEFVNDSEVSIKTNGGEFVSVSLDSFDENSLGVIDTWASLNPELVGVYASWDKKPSVVRSRTAVTPPQLNSPGFRGIVSLQVILDEAGRVSHAEVNKSSHSDLEDAALAAIKKWSFKPASIAGNAVKARIAISFKFEA